MKDIITVDLKAYTNCHPLDLASHAAGTCYQSEEPEWGKRIDVESRLFNTGHHTTLQHWYFTFFVEGLSVADITFGLHLCSPFYNSDQRSGRFSKMYSNFGEAAEHIKAYISKFWPDLKPQQLSAVLDFIKSGAIIYGNYIDEAAQKAAGFIQQERPKASEKYISANAPKFAQEQLRMFLPIISPTAFDFTVNLSTLVAMLMTAWTPPMRYVLGKMAGILQEEFPEIDFMFRGDARSEDWAIHCPYNLGNRMNFFKPELNLVSGSLFGMNIQQPDKKDLFPVDLLHFDPRYMDNNIDIKTRVQISVATMGQDQRHRTIRRSCPEFTGDFYLPPIPTEIGLHNEARKIMRRWSEISENIPSTLAMALAPYGAMVKYSKSASLNAVVHEQAKRTCWCAQEEIYHLGCTLRKATGQDELFSPECYKTGVCAEGSRYCGRDISLREGGDYFPERKV